MLHGPGVLALERGDKDRRDDDRKQDFRADARYLREPAAAGETA
jgi:hypothetical protein